MKQKCTLVLSIVITICLFLPSNVYASGNWRVAVCEDTPPFHFVDDSGNIIGLHIDLLEEIASVKGYTIEFEYYPTVSEAISALEERQVDFVLGALPGDVIGNANVTFSENLSTAAISAFVKNEKLNAVLESGYPQTGAASAAFELGTLGYSQTAHQMPASFVVCGSQKQLYRALQKKSVDVIIGNHNTMMYLMEQDGIREDYTVINSAIDNVGYALMYHNGDTVLQSIINDGIRNIHASSNYDKFLSKWMVDMEKEDMQKRIRNLLWIGGSIAAAAGIIIAIFYYMNYRLKHLVDEKTRELNEKILELEAASNLRNKLLEHIPGGSILASADGTILYAGPIARSMMRTDADELPENVQNTALFSAVWSQIDPVSTPEMETPGLMELSMDGEKHTYRYQYHPTGANQEVVLTVEDVTWEEQIKREEFEERKNQTLNRVIAGVAHEIKNPLTTIRNFASMIERKGNAPDFQTAFHEYIPREVDRISRMIETLINYARPPREQKIRISAKELVKDSVALAYLSSKKHINVEYDVPENVYIRVNPDQIRQSLINLLINSIEAVEAKANGAEYTEELQIRISSYRSNNTFVLEIFDQGSGMSDEDIRQCTDPFYTTKRSGTGMGLALTKQFIRENGGQLEIESELGKYTRMKMIFKEICE